MRQVVFETNVGYDFAARAILLSPGLKMATHSMLYLIAIAAAVIIAASLFADYKWRRWMEDRKQERDHDQP